MYKVSPTASYIKCHSIISNPQHGHPCLSGPSLLSPPPPPTPHHTIGSAWLPLAKFRCAGPILTISEAISGANEIKPPLDRPLPKWLLQRVEAELVIMEQRDTSPTLPSANTPWLTKTLPQNYGKLSQNYGKLSQNYGKEHLH